MKALFRYEKENTWLVDIIEILRRYDLKNRVVKKALLHTSKVFHNYEYARNLKYVGEILRYFTFTHKEDLRFEVVKPDDFRVKVLGVVYELFSVSPYKRKLTKRVWVVAQSGNRITGWILLSPPPGVLGVRTHFLPSLAGGGRWYDGFEERRGHVLNKLAWVSQVRALGDFRTARGVKGLYLSVFTEKIYHKLANYWGGLLGLETLVMYGARSQVFRNLKGLYIHHKVTEGFSDLIFPQVFREDFRTCYVKNGNLMRALKNEMRKGYFLLSTLLAEELDRRIYKAVFEGEEDFSIPTLPDHLPFEKLKTQNLAGSEEDLVFWRLAWELERKAIKEESFSKVFDLFLNFYQTQEGRT